VPPAEGMKTRGFWVDIIHKEVQLAHSDCVAVSYRQMTPSQEILIDVEDTIAETIALDAIPSEHTAEYRAGYVSDGPTKVVIKVKEGYDTLNGIRRELATKKAHIFTAASRSESAFAKKNTKASVPDKASVKIDELALYDE
jgi:hypothetical protein